MQRTRKYPKLSHPAFPRPPSSPSRAEHHCQDFDLIASNLHFQGSELLGAIRPIYLLIVGKIYCSKLK